MSKGLAFWILMLLWFFSWAIGAYNTPNAGWQSWAGSLLLFVLLALLGWAVFGDAIK